MKKYSRLYIYVFGILLFILFAQTALAEGYIIQGQIPGIDYESGSPESFLSSIYNWGIGIVGLLAFIQLTVGGIQYMISGAIDKKNEAKSRITDAAIGLLLALASVLIVEIINPNLVNIRFGLEPISTTSPATQTTQSQPTQQACAGLSTAECVITTGGLDAEGLGVDTTSPTPQD